ncbi:hypothetical protein J6590_107259 [Homalodisca vitripennis]|nr:hypothetical protein J6590_107259 [Homalodisca vitripennis]
MFCGARFPSRASTRPPHRISRHVQRGGRDCQWIVRDITNSVQKCFVVRGSPLAHLRNLHIESLGMYKGEEEILGGLPPHRISRHVQRGGRDSRWFVRDLTTLSEMFCSVRFPSRTSTRPPQNLCMYKGEGISGAVPLSHLQTSIESLGMYKGERDCQWIKCFVVRGSPLAHLLDLHIESLGMYKGGGRDCQWIVRHNQLCPEMFCGARFPSRASTRPPHRISRHVQGRKGLSVDCKRHNQLCPEMFCSVRFPSRASTRPPHRISRHVQRGGRDSRWIVRDITNSVQKCFVVCGSPSRASTRPPHRISRHVQRGGRDSRWIKCFVVRGSPLAHLRDLHIESLGMYKGGGRDCQWIVRHNQLCPEMFCGARFPSRASTRPPHRISRHVQGGGRDCQWIVRHNQLCPEMFCGARFPSRASTRPPHRISRHVQGGGRDSRWFVRDITNSVQKCFVVCGSPSRASTRPPHRISRHVQRGGRDSRWIVRDITNSVQKCFVVCGSPSRASTRPPHRISRHVQGEGLSVVCETSTLSRNVLWCAVPLSRIY